MKSTLIFLMLVLMLGAGLCWAQAPANCTPNPLNIPEAKYPRILPPFARAGEVCPPQV